MHPCTAVQIRTTQYKCTALFASCEHADAALSRRACVRVCLGVLQSRGSWRKHQGHLGESRTGSPWRKHNRGRHLLILWYQQVRYAARERIPVQGIRLTVDKNQLPAAGGAESNADNSPWQRESNFRVRVAGKSLQVCHPSFLLLLLLLLLLSVFCRPSSTTTTISSFNPL